MRPTRNAWAAGRNRYTSRSSLSHSGVTAPDRPRAGPRLCRAPPAVPLGLKQGTKHRGETLPALPEKFSGKRGGFHPKNTAAAPKGRVVCFPKRKLPPEGDRPGPARSGSGDTRRFPRFPASPAALGGTPCVGPSREGSHLAAFGLLPLLTEADRRQAGQVESGTERCHKQKTGCQQPHLPA